MGTEFVFHELQINRVIRPGRKDIEPLQLAKRMLEGFTRALYIEIDLGADEEELEDKAGKIADDLGLCLQKTKGSLNLLEKTVFEAIGTKPAGA